MTTKLWWSLSTECRDIRLQEFLPEDARILFKLIDRNREYLKHLRAENPEKYPSYSAVHRSIAHPAESDRKRFGIWCRGVLAGMISTPPLKERPWIAEVDYWVGEEFCGQEVATLATRAVVTKAHELVGANEIVACILRRNEASERVLEKTGFSVLQEDSQHRYFQMAAPVEQALVAEKTERRG